MASQQRTIPSLGLDDPSGVRLAAHDPRIYLLRLLLIAALTGAVVAVWSTQDAAPSANSAGARLGFETPPAATTEITTPAVESRSGLTPPTLALNSDGDRVRPQASAIPRPPELPEPVAPFDFIRFTVQRGDTVFDISLVYGVSIAEILRYNPQLGDGSRVDVGDLVYVPVLDEPEADE